MIASGEKKEEYREIKPYWALRLMNDVGTFRDFAFIVFKNGYGKNAPSMTIKWEGTRFGCTKPEWADHWEDLVFIIDLGEIVSKNF